MKWTLITILFSSFLSCQGQNANINFIEREVYVNDTLLEITQAKFEDTSTVFSNKSNEVIQSLEQINSNKSTESSKYIVYNIILSNNTKQIVKTYRPNPQLDNLMRFDGGVDGDETFEIDWWLKDDEIERIVVPSSDW